MPVLWPHNPEGTREAGIYSDPQWTHLGDGGLIKFSAEARTACVTLLDRFFAS